MNNNVQSKKILIFLLAIILVVFVGISSKYIDIKSIFQRPYKTIKPQEGFIAGTTIDLYKNAPTGFPKEVILENQVPYHSASVNTEDGKKQIILSYFSDKSPLEVATMYTNSLPKVNWSIISKTISKDVSIIVATQRNRKLVLTVSPGKNIDTVSSLVTFQYSL